jgi:hypothetical protein
MLCGQATPPITGPALHTAAQDYERGFQPSQAGLPLYACLQYMVYHQAWRYGETNAQQCLVADSVCPHPHAPCCAARQEPMGSLRQVCDHLKLLAWQTALPLSRQIRLPCLSSCCVPMLTGASPPEVPCVAKQACEALPDTLQDAGHNWGRVSAEAAGTMRCMLLHAEHILKQPYTREE